MSALAGKTGFRLEHKQSKSRQKDSLRLEAGCEVISSPYRPCTRGKAHVSSLLLPGPTRESGKAIWMISPD